MAKTVADVVLDAALNYIKNNGTRLCVCSTQPATYTDAITTLMLAIKTIASTDYTGPVDDAVDTGRKISANLENGISVTNSGTAGFIAIADSVNSALLYVTTCTAQVLTAGNTVNVPAWKMTLKDPV